MELTEIPGRAFLDTSALNFVLDHGESIFNGVPVSDNLSERVKDDIDSFYNIFLTGSRANWQLAISPFTYREIICTTDFSKRKNLQKWFYEVWSYWVEIIKQNNDLPTFLEAEHIKLNILSSGALDCLPDIEDRMLICDAIVYRCDCFCTRDWETILKYRDEIGSLPIKIITPTEWWNLIKPYAALWV